MYQKAVQFKDQETAENILETKCPVEAKQLGKTVKGFNADIWKKAAIDIMYKAMYKKFAQNEQLRQFLRKTTKANLVEASPTDTISGVGISLQNDSMFNPNNWRGKNLAGQILMRVRQTLS